VGWDAGREGRGMGCDAGARGAWDANGASSGQVLRPDVQAVALPLANGGSTQSLEGWITYVTETW
jgi:hypothetical protein